MMLMASRCLSASAMRNKSIFLFEHVPAKGHQDCQLL
jgi:hypothetical protein